MESVDPSSGEQPSGSHVGSAAPPAAFAANPLFKPFRLGSLALPNRIVMAPMTRAFSPGGVPGENVASYYATRAQGGVGLIVTEGSWIPEPHASNDPNVPDFHGEAALNGWAEVLRKVRASGGHIMPQLWHTGISRKPDVEAIYASRSGTKAQIGPSGLLRKGQVAGRAMASADFDNVLKAYVDAAVNAFSLGFDGIELHGAHGYLLDQFFWHETNARSDRYGGSMASRTDFACDVVRAIRSGTGPNFPIIMRLSQWKLVDYDAKLAHDPRELENLLSPLIDAGVDLFHCSQRRFWEPEFEGSNLNFAGWCKKLSGKPTISVGSVSLDGDIVDMTENMRGAGIASLDRLFERMEREEFDLIAVGRALITNPDWPRKVQEGRMDELVPFTVDSLLTLS